MRSRLASIRVSNSRKGSRAEAVVIGKMYLGSKPEFGLPLSLLDMDVRRFTRLTFVGIEEKSKAAGSEDGWHRAPDLSRLAACCYGDDTARWPGGTTNSSCVG